jgi:hypothetical protein
MVFRRSKLMMIVAIYFGVMLTTGIMIYLRARMVFVGRCNFRARDSFTIRAYYGTSNSLRISKGTM